MGSFWDSVIDVGADIIGGVLSESGKKDPKTPDVSPSTKSGESKTSTQILFDQEAMGGMKNLSYKLTEWGDLDRDFMENTYRPFQEDLIATNTQLINMIGKNSNLALEESIKDLTGSAALKSIFRQNITSTGAQISETANRFATEIQNLPTTEQRIGQAASAVEQQFGKAGADIRGRLKAQGLQVSQATERDLAIQKATAKAGAVGAAAEGARAERMNALATGAGVFSNLQASQSQQLASQQAQTQSGVGLIPQVSGVTMPTDAATKQAGDMVAGMGMVSRGVESTDKDLNITQKGVTSGSFPGLDGGKLFNADGTPTDTGAKLEGTLSPEEMEELRQFESNSFEGGTGSGNGTLQENNPKLFDKAIGVLGVGAGILTGGLTGNVGIGKAAYDQVTGYFSGNDSDGSRGTGSGAGTGGGRGGETETESDKTGSGGMGGV